jgi:hypothetical protein
MTNFPPPLIEPNRQNSLIGQLSMPPCSAVHSMSREYTLIVRYGVSDLDKTGDYREVGLNQLTGSPSKENMKVK